MNISPNHTGSTLPDIWANCANFKTIYNRASAGRLPKGLRPGPRYPSCSGPRSVACRVLFNIPLFIGTNIKTNITKRLDMPEISIFSLGRPLGCGGFCSAEALVDLLRCAPFGLCLPLLGDMSCMAARRLWISLLTPLRPSATLRCPRRNRKVQSREW